MSVKQSKLQKKHVIVHVVINNENFRINNLRIK